jgi:transcriptional regulator with XRE-family HTH domain
MKRALLSVEWLESAMIERNWTQSYVAEQMDVDPTTIRKWLRGVHRPQPRQFYRLCTLFEHPLPPGFPIKEDAVSERSAEGERQTSPVAVNPAEKQVREIQAPTREDAYTRFQAINRTTPLLALVSTWSLRNVNARYHALQAFLVRELEQKDNTIMQEHPINRRNALRCLASWPIELYGLSLILPSMLHAPEEFLSQCAAGITACWYLRKGKDLAFVSDTVSRYIPTLKKIVSIGKGTLRTDAAELLAQCLLLKGLCVNHTHGDPLASLRYTKEAETYSELAENPMLAVVAVRLQANAYDYADNWVQAMHAAEKAKYIIETAGDSSLPSLVQSFVYVGLANYQAHCEQEQEALTSLRLAEDAFIASKDESSPPVWVDHNEANLLLMSGLTYYYLDNQEEAIKSLARIDALADTRETARAESLIAQVMAEIGRNDKPRNMEFCIENWQKGVQGAVAIRSKSRLNEARTAYIAMRAAWPGEQRIKDLRDYIAHW